MSRRALIIAALFLLLVSARSLAGGENELHVFSHKNTKVITDPSKGVNPYRAWTVFPSKRTRYRRAELSVTYRCPDSLHCGESRSIVVKERPLTVRLAT